jgi:hypothetical protein
VRRLGAHTLKRGDWQEALAGDKASELGEVISVSRLMRHAALPGSRRRASSLSRSLLLLGPSFGLSLFTISPRTHSIRQASQRVTLVNADPFIGPLSARFGAARYKSPQGCSVSLFPTDLSSPPPLLSSQSSCSIMRLSSRLSSPSGSPAPPSRLTTLPSSLRPLEPSGPPAAGTVDPSPGPSLSSSSAPRLLAS